MVWCGVVWCGVVWCGVVWCGVVWCGVVWCGVVWCGVVWCGVVWCGVVWCGLIHCDCWFQTLYSHSHSTESTPLGYQVNKVTKQPTVIADVAGKRCNWLLEKAT